LVEEDYRVKGSIDKTDRSIMPSERIDIRDVFDDVVDVIIEKVLETGGKVTFMDGGSLKNHRRIALIPKG